MDPTDYISMELVEVPLQAARSVDEEAVSRAARGDAQAFARLVEQYGRDALAAAIGILRNRGEAEECVQEAFYRAWRELASLREPGKFRGWFAGILYRVCVDVRRARGRELRAQPQVIRRSSGGAGADPAAARVVDEAMALPEEYREPLVLFYLQDLPIADLAAAIGISEANAKVRLHRARRMLRERMERRGGNP